MKSAAGAIEGHRSSAALGEGPGGGGERAGIGAAASGEGGGAEVEIASAGETGKACRCEAVEVQAVVDVDENGAVAQGGCVIKGDLAGVDHRVAGVAGVAEGEGAGAVVSERPV